MTEQDKFTSKYIKIWNYSSEVKEAMIVDYIGQGQGKGKGRLGNKSSDVSEKDREHNIKRVKRNCRRLAFANNLGKVHLILTYKENMQDIDKADEHFKAFMKEIHKLYGGLKYLATRELQQRGAVHYHILLNQRVDVRKVQKIWKHGFIKLVQHQNQLKAVMYVLKYISKEVGETVMTTKNGHTKKAYLSSRGLKQEVEGCTLKYVINNPDTYVEFVDKLNFIMTNLTEGWDLEFDIPIGTDKEGNEISMHGRSILKCAANE